MRLSLALLFLLSLVSCKKNEGVSLHQDYQPMDSGKYIIYSAKDIVHDDLTNIHDTTEYMLKVKIGADYLDNEGRPNKEYIRYKSLDNGATWNISDVWYLYRDVYRMELIEENQRKIKLAYAPTLDKEWDLNAYNEEDEQEVRYDEVHNEYSVSGTSFDSTVTVLQDDFYSLVDYSQQFEVYAKNIGMVQKYYKDLRIIDFDTNKVQKGTESYLIYLSHGVE